MKLLPLLLLLLTSCGATHYERRGDRLTATGEHHAAATAYKTAYTKTPPKSRQLRATRALKLARSYSRLNQAPRAAAAYRNAIRLGTDSATLRQALARELMRAADYKAAATEYTLAADTAGRHAALQAAQARRQPPTYTVRRADRLNSRRADYAPCLHGADRLYITTTRPTATGRPTTVTGDQPGDIYTATRDSHGQWTTPEPIPNLNTAADEGACALTPDGTLMFLTICADNPPRDTRAQIAVSRRTGAQWGAPQPVTIAGDTLHNFAHPAVSPDGQWLIFASDMPHGLGGYDLWRVPLADGKYTAPENLGADINTAGDELFPTFRHNGDLCFSSDGRHGLGGLDIYIATPDPQSASLSDRHAATQPGRYTISHPGWPLNSQGDDFSLTFLPGQDAGFLASNRGDARGRDHIYTFENTTRQPTVRGYVYDRDGYELPAAQVYLVGDDGTNTRPRVSGDGSFTAPITAGVSYIILATCTGYLNHACQLAPLPQDSAATAGERVLQFPLASIRVPVPIENIHYDFDRATLRPESAAALDKLVTLLEQNPAATIEIGAHCDYKGTAAYNQRLSEARAASVVTYLTAHGVAPERLTARGYGKTRPRTVSRALARRHPWLTEGATLTPGYTSTLTAPQRHACDSLNRRTEFSVLRTSPSSDGERGN